MARSRRRRYVSHSEQHQTMLNSEAPPNYASVEDGTGTAAIAEPPRRSWGRILAATLACVALATIAFSGAVQLRTPATVTAFPGEAGTLYAQCRDSGPPCDSGLHCAESGRCLAGGPCTCTGGTAVAGNVCKSGEQKCASCRGGPYTLVGDYCRCESDNEGKKCDGPGWFGPGSGDWECCEGDGLSCKAVGGFGDRVILYYACQK